MKDTTSSGGDPRSNNWQKSYSGKKGHVPDGDFGEMGASVTESRHNGSGDSVYKQRHGRKRTFGGVSKR